MMISKTPEPVDYHPLRSCAPSASSMNIKFEETVVTRLSYSNKQFFCGVNSVFDSINGRQIFFCVSKTKSTHFLVFGFYSNI